MPTYLIQQPLQAGSHQFVIGGDTGGRGVLLPFRRGVGGGGGGGGGGGSELVNVNECEWV